MRRRRIVDVTMYNGEAVMRQRLRYLAPHVDAFVVVEAAHTHSGRRKRAYFVDTEYDDVFGPHAAKLRIVRVDWGAGAGGGGPGAAWARERRQRDAALPTLLDMAGGEGGEEFVAVVADADEVPTAAALDALRTMPLGTDPVHLDMFTLYYSPRTMVVGAWRKAFAVAGRALTPATGLTALRLRDPPAALLPAAGFHLSFFMTPDEVRRKIESFAHREFDTDEVKARVNANMREGRDVFERPGVRLLPTPEPVLRMLPRELAR